MPHYSAQPVDPVDAAARRALARFLAAHAQLPDHLNVNPRTLQRIIAGKRYLPPRLAGEAAELADKAVLPLVARDLRAWAATVVEG